MGGLTAARLFYANVERLEDFAAHDFAPDSWKLLGVLTSQRLGC